MRWFREAWLPLPFQAAQTGHSDNPRDEPLVMSASPWAPRPIITCTWPSFSSIPWISAQEWLGKSETLLLLQRGVWFSSGRMFWNVPADPDVCAFRPFQTQFKLCWHFRDRRTAQRIYFLEITRMRLRYICFCGLLSLHPLNFIMKMF